MTGTTSRPTDAGGSVAFTDLAIAGAPGARTLIFAAAGYAPATSTPISLGVGAPAVVAAAAGTGRPRRPVPRCRCGRRWSCATPAARPLPA